MKNLGFLGEGISFPIRIHPGTGRFELSSGFQNVKESVYLILMTGRGERWMRPAFGGDLLSYTFVDMSTTMLNIMSHEIRTLLLDQEPRISDVMVKVEEEHAQNMLIINISYIVIDKNTQDNLVFPFYLRTVKEEVFDGAVDYS